jgi:hypothetical protein
MKKLAVVFLAVLFFASPVYADLTVDKCIWVNMGSARMRVCEVDFDESYYTNGEPLSYTANGLPHIISVHAEPLNGYTFIYDYTNYVLRAYRGPDNESSAASDLSDLSDIKVTFIGW